MIVVEVEGFSKNKELARTNGNKLSGIFFPVAL